MKYNYLKAHSTTKLLILFIILLQVVCFLNDEF